MSRSGGESNQLHSKHLCHCWFVWSLCNHTNQSTQSKPEVLGDCAGGAGTGPVNLTFLVCVSCHSDLIVTHVSKITDVKDHWCQTLLFWGTLSLTHHCWCLGPSQTSSCPWSSSGRCWIQPQGALLSQESPPTTEVEWNTKCLIPLRKERDVFILFCLFLYELEVFSNPVCWLQ